jgi:hypothetical protein
MKKFLLAVPFVVALSACDGPLSSTQIERQKQEEISKQGVESVGFPAITNFAEKRMMKDIIELRDQNVATTTYITDMNGRLHKVCNSVGYGLPYATQYTNPMRAGGGGSGGYYTIPQADPNGLYSPASADGTWILCVDAKSGKPKPVYVEPRVIVSPFPLGE